METHRTSSTWEIQSPEVILYILAFTIAWCHVHVLVFEENSLGPLRHGNDPISEPVGRSRKKKIEFAKRQGFLNRLYSNRHSKSCFHGLSN